MKKTLDDINKILIILDSAREYVKVARHEARKVYSNDAVVAQDLKYAYQNLQVVMKALEGDESL